MLAIWVGGLVRFSTQHLIAAAVAAGCVGVALDSGGYPIGFIAGACLILWWLVLACVLLRVWPRRDPPQVALWTGIALALFAAWTAISLIWASDDGAAFVELVRVLAYLGLFAVVLCTSGREGARPWLGGLTVGLTAVCLLALATRFEPGLGHGDLTGSRLSYPIGYWNGLATCAAMSLTLLAWQSVHARSAGLRSASTAALPLPALAVFLSASRGGVAASLIGLAVLVALGPRRYPLTAGVAIAAVGTAPLIFLANSQDDLLEGLRNTAASNDGHLLLAASVGVVVAIGLVRHSLDRRLMSARLSGTARGLVLAAGIAAFLAVIAAENPIERLDQFKQPPQPPSSAEGPGGFVVSQHFSSDNGSGRYQFWGAALDAFGEHPVRGIGAGQYETWWNQHGSIYWILLDAHSLLFEVAAELGSVGILLLLLLLGLPAWSAARRRAGPHGAEVAALAALLATGVLAASIDWMWELPAAFGPIVVAIALLTGPATDWAQRPSGALRSATRRWLAGGAIALVGWAAVLSSGDLLLTELQLDQSRSAAAEGDPGDAADAARDAISLQPWAAAPRLQLGLVEEWQDRLPAARSALRAAAERAPLRWEIWFILARVEANSNRLAAARAALRRARELNPRSPLVRSRPPFLP